jgi:hypothetical protein
MKGVNYIIKAIHTPGPRLIQVPPEFIPQKLSRLCIQNLQDWLPEATTANGTDLYHKVRFFRYFVSQSIEFCHHNPLKATATSNTKGKHIYLYRLIPEKFWIYRRINQKFREYVFIYLFRCSLSLSLCLLGSTAQLRPWPLPQNLAEFLGGFSTTFFFTG